MSSAMGNALWSMGPSFANKDSSLHGSIFPTKAGPICRKLLTINPMGMGAGSSP